jgi:putative transposase
MAIPRSTFYGAPVAQLDETVIISQIRTICDEFESYGYRRVGAAEDSAADARI